MNLKAKAPSLFVSLIGILWFALPALAQLPPQELLSRVAEEAAGYQCE